MSGHATGSHAFTLALPAGYDSADALAFHARDREGLAERVDAAAPYRIRKGVVLDGAATLIDIVLDDGAARCNVDTDGGADVVEQARGAATGMLGLHIDPAPFMRAVDGDALLGPVVRRRPGLRVIQSATVFEALTWAVIGQQINLAFAISLRRSFIEQAGRRHASGLWCYPEALDVARLDPVQLTSRKFSRAKAETLLRLAGLVADGDLDLARNAEPHEVTARLVAVKGIGPWTANYSLLRGWGHPDCSLHGDVAVRSAIGRLLGLPEKPGLAEAEAFLLNYRPHRTLAAAHLWSSLSD
jgi:DNA-3-methyladenine glycosylase II